MCMEWKKSQNIYLSLENDYLSMENIYLSMENIYLSMENIYLSMENRPPVAGEEGRDGWKVLKMAVYKIISICLYGW